MLKRILISGVLVSAIALGGCAGFQSWFTTTSANVQEYAPLVGQDLLLFGQDVIAAECSPLANATSTTAKNVLNIVAPDTKTATAIENYLALNTAVAAQLCPLVATIETQVGSVPSGTPTQTITTAPTTTSVRRFKLPFISVYNGGKTLVYNVPSK